MDPLRTLDHPLAHAWGLAPARSWARRSSSRAWTSRSWRPPQSSVAQPVASPRPKRRAHHAQDTQNALERAAAEEPARQLQAARREGRRRTSRASTILAPPLGVTTPLGFAAGGRSTLG